ncbi:MAG TPA: DUF378 domain-containing protein [Solirubrobacteraceae bacterium]|nr:DUF378 domain-containing protein [Solirubrobacteraceae bacterium]
MTFIKRLEPLWLVLVIIAGLNWAIVALFDTNVISDVLGGGTLTDIAYVAIGVAALTFVPRLLEDLRLGDRMHAHGH